MAARGIHNRRHGMVRNGGARRNVQNHVQSNNFRLVQPDEIDVNFEDVFGHQECKKELSNIINYLQDPEPYEKFGVVPYSKYYVSGIEGIGRSTLICSIAKKVDIPIVIVEPSFYFNTTSILDELDQIFELIYSHLERGKNCMLMFKDIEHISALEPDVEQPLIERLIGYLRDLPDLVAFATIEFSDGIKLSTQLLLPPAFSKGIDLLPPELKVREQILTNLLKNIPTDKNLDIHRLAADMADMTTGFIKHIIRDAALICRQNDKEALSYEDFSEAMAQLDFGYAGAKHSKEERLATARHEAGHVVAGYYSNPKDYKISKVDITPRSFYCGITQETEDEDKHALFKEDLENRIVTMLGGMAAEELFYGSTTTGVQNDLRNATKIAIHMHKIYGMADRIGSMCLLFENMNFAQLDNECDYLIQKFMRKMYSRAQKIVREHKHEIDELVNALLEKEVLYTDEIMAILTKRNKVIKKEDNRGIIKRFMDLLSMEVSY